MTEKIKIKKQSQFGILEKEAMLNITSSEWMTVGAFADKHNINKDVLIRWLYVNIHGKRAAAISRKYPQCKDGEIRVYSPLILPHLSTIVI